MDKSGGLKNIAIYLDRKEMHNKHQLSIFIMVSHVKVAGVYFFGNFELASLLAGTP